MKTEGGGAGPTRADRYLHHVRIFKTRGFATQACGKGQVTLDGKAIKASRALRVEDVLEVERGELRLRLKVVGFPPRRIGAKMVPSFMENLTPEEWIRAASERRKELQMQNPHPHESALKPNKQQLRKMREWWEAGAGELD